MGPSWVLALCDCTAPTPTKLALSARLPSSLAHLSSMTQSLPSPLARGQESTTLLESSHSIQGLKPLCLSAVILQGLGGPIWHDGRVSLAISWMCPGGDTSQSVSTNASFRYKTKKQRKQTKKKLELNSPNLGNRKILLNIL